MIGRAADNVRALDVELFRLFEEGNGVSLGDIPGRDAFACGPHFHLVIALILIRGEVADIGDIHHMFHVQPGQAQGAHQHVGGDIGAHIADMGVVIDGRSTRIDARLTCFDGIEDLGCARHRVVEFHFHWTVPVGWLGLTNKRASLA
jgi:hypothetical protein